jgi:hypothetical protein
MARILSLSFVVAVLSCGPAVSPGGTDGGATGGGTGTGGGTAATVASSTGTISGMPAGLASGYARLDANSVLLILSNLAPGWACPTQTPWLPRANEASINVILHVPAGGSLTGTFPFASSSPTMPGQALGFVLRAPASCPAPVGDGTLVNGGTITLTSTTTGSLVGSLHALITGGEVLDAQFALPFCAIWGIGGQCTP